MSDEIRRKALEVLDRLVGVETEDETLAAIDAEREREEAADRARVASTRDDLLAGRVTRDEAVEALGHRRWERVVAGLDDETLRRVIGGDA